MTRDYRVVAESLVLERASFDVIKALRGAGVRAILLKGPLQQAWLETEGPPRVSVDVDVLVQREQLADAGDAVRMLGYLPAVTLPGEVGREHASVWLAAGRIPVEVHWSLVGVDENRVWDVLAAATETTLLMGERIEIPNEAARCLIVALHAAQHGVGRPAIFNDLEKALAVAGTETWWRAFELANAVGGWTPFGGALSITPRGRELLAEFGLAPPVLGEREALSLLTPGPTSRGFYFLARESGPRAKALFVLMKLAPSPEFMRLRYPRARTGPGGLAMAYLYRPFWLVRWALPGLRSWRRARDLAKVSERYAGTHDHEADSARSRQGTELEDPRGE